MMTEQPSTCDSVRHFPLQEVISPEQYAITTQCQPTTTSVPEPVSAELKVTSTECKEASTIMNQTRSTHPLADRSPYPRLLCQCRMLVMHDPCDDTPFTVPLHAISCPNRLQNLLSQKTGSTDWVRGCSKPAIKRVHRQATVRKRQEWKTLKDCEEKKSLEQILASL
ncbi:uncharacterized protein LY79DRAFT_566762 [Colletotrichum navitas]|uniref:Uncharacterized protein n=1 Tax=Colletotrichum navitas TaxID=681940 RepID=A0AAD8PQF7_9PEZI|nr:uncharacterized protein LY79DRAFT_566762 [Colletotrichum navitas]KAK1574098.1 hypothetical protein LY79DRAFT_566762 [Colletotrichum navitas]